MMLSVEKALLDKEIPKARNLVGHLVSKAGINVNLNEI